MARVRQVRIRTRQLVTGVLQGAYRSNFRGTGIEFEEVRPYQPGDEVRSIDWNVTARTGEAHVKTYIEERQLILQLLVDQSRSMDFGSAERTKRDVAAEVAALMTFVASAEQDMVGLALYDQGTGVHLKPGVGSRHAQRLVREVLGAQATGGASDLGAALEEQMRHLRTRAMMMVISDFLGLEDDHWEEVLPQLTRRHDVIFVRIYDPFEEQLPDAGLLLMQDIESGQELEIDSSSARVRKHWALAAEERRAKLERALHRARVDLVEISTRDDVSGPIIACFERRARTSGGMR